MLARTTAVIATATPGTSGIVGFTYQAMAEGRMAHLRTMMDAVIDAEVTFMVPILRTLFVIYVGRQFLMAFAGYLTIDRFFNSVIRSGIVILLIAHSGQFVQWVRDPIFDKIPQAINSTILSSSGVSSDSGMNPAQQFDQVSQAIDAVTAQVLTLNTAWSVAAAGNYFTAMIANGGAQLVLGCIAAIWLLGQTLLAIILCFGPLVLVFELFDRTRGWVDQWIGKLVGMTSFGIGTSVLLALQMTELMQSLTNLNGAIPSSGAEAAGALSHVVGNIVLDALTMAALPLICSIGSGVAASLAAPSAMLALRGAPGAVGMAGRAAAASARGGRAATRANSVTRA